MDSCSVTKKQNLFCIQFLPTCTSQSSATFISGVHVNTLKQMVGNCNFLCHISDVVQALAVFLYFTSHQHTILIIWYWRTTVWQHVKKKSHQYTIGELTSELQASSLSVSMVSHILLYRFTSWHGIISQKTGIISNTAVRTSNLTI
jgi:hypothetical protein